MPDHQHHLYIRMDSTGFSEVFFYWLSRFVWNWQVRPFYTVTRLSTAGDRAFPVASARTWNSLSRSLTSLSSLASFRRQLKTELFVRSFSDLDSSAHDRIWQILCSHFALHSRFVTVFSVCKVSLQSFDIAPPKSFLSIIIIIIIIIMLRSMVHKSKKQYVKENVNEEIII